MLKRNWNKIRLFCHILSLVKFQLGRGRTPCPPPLGYAYTPSEENKKGVRKFSARFLAFSNEISTVQKDSAVLEPRTGQFSRTWGFEAKAKAKDLTFEAKAKDFKMCPRGQGRPRGLHLWSLPYNFEVKMLSNSHHPVNMLIMGQYCFDIVSYSHSVLYWYGVLILTQHRFAHRGIYCFDIVIQCCLYVGSYSYDIVILYWIYV